MSCWIIASIRELRSLRPLDSLISIPSGICPLRAPSSGWRGPAYCPKACFAIVEGNDETRPDRALAGRPGGGCLRRRRLRRRDHVPGGGGDDLRAHREPGEHVRLHRGAVAREREPG